MYVWSKRAFGEFPGFMTGWPTGPAIYLTFLPYFILPRVMRFTPDRPVGSHYPTTERISSCSRCWALHSRRFSM